MPILQMVRQTRENFAEAIKVDLSEENNMENGIASIKFLPVCSNCWKIIWQEIDGTERIGIVCGNPKLMGATYNISPEKCPHCGAFFNNITMPTKLPFDNDIL